MKSVLVVEDDDTIRTTTAFLLEEAGYAPVEAGNGAEALEKLAEVKPDIILCDVTMPRMDGHEFLGHVKNDTATADIPFIFLTAKNDRMSMRTGMTLGADDYLTKPFTFGELTKAVEAGLAKRQRHAESSRQQLDTLRQNISYALPHELVTPLNGIIGASEMLMDMHEKLPPAETREMLRMVHSSGQRLYQLIRNTLLYAQLELARNDAERIAALRNCTADITELLLENICKAKAATFQRINDVAWTCDECSVAIAPEHLQNIIEEIVDNALKFSEENMPVHVSANAGNSNFTLTVSDAGRGMTAKEIEDIGAFMQFQRKLYEQQGAGLGLAVTRQLISLHGGTFAIDSEPHTRTTVTVTLPLANEFHTPMMQ